MLLKEIIDNAIGPALELLPPAMDTSGARVMLLAIGLQESRFTARRQLVGNPPRAVGPARGLWQFEQGGGVRGVLAHPSSRDYAIAVCDEREVAATARDVYNMLEYDDVLAAAFARLLLWTDPGKLPRVGDADAAWALYLRTWRPGKPHPQTWNALYAQAVAAVEV